ncbi:MAG TPA: protein-disulfide reductase DsbD domain-containing protein [Arsenophonus sp.]
MLNIFRNSLAALFLLWLTVVFAADTGWLKNSDDNHTEVRLRADNSFADVTRILLNIRLQNGWKTYWRTPGEGGITSTISWQDNSINAQWFWPTPQRFDISVITTQDYHKGLTLPIQLNDKVSTPLLGTLTLSTCSTVCIILTNYPFTLDLQQLTNRAFGYDYAAAMAKFRKKTHYRQN